MNNLWIKRHSQRILDLELSGGLGNQLFQVAAALSIQPEKLRLHNGSLGVRVDENGLPDIFGFDLPKTIQLMGSEHHSSLLHGFAARLAMRSSLLQGNCQSGRTLKLLLVTTTGVLLSIDGGRAIKPYVDNLPSGHVATLGQPWLFGHYQNQAYILSQIDVIENIRSWEPTTTSRIYEDLVFEARASRPIVLHLRLGDYLNESKFGIPSPAYYSAGIDYLTNIGKVGAIWVFSDEPGRARSYLQKMERFPAKRIRFMGSMGELSPAQIMKVMTYGGAFILANSTFSWWAALLSNCPPNSIVAPYPWFLDTVPNVSLEVTDWHQIAAKHVHLS